MERYNKQEHPKINILTFTSYICIYRRWCLCLTIKTFCDEAFYIFFCHGTFLHKILVCSRFLMSIYSTGIVQTWTSGWDWTPGLMIIHWYLLKYCEHVWRIWKRNKYYKSSSFGQSEHFKRQFKSPYFSPGHRLSVTQGVTSPFILFTSSVRT